MKKLMFFGFLFIFITGCEKKENKVEVINLSNGEYSNASQIDNPEKVLTLSTSRNLYDKIEKEVKDIETPGDEQDNYSFILMVNERGKLDKIIILYAPNENTAKIITSVLSEQKYNIGYINGHAVKYQFNWSYSPGYKTMADKMPEIIGGFETIQKNLHYPEIAKRAGIEGRVFISAIVNEAGDVVKTKVIKGIGSGCDEAAENAIKKLKFIPGMNNGKPVKVMIVIPIVFKLTKKTDNSL